MLNTNKYIDHYVHQRYYTELYPTGLYPFTYKANTSNLGTTTTVVLQ